MAELIDNTFENGSLLRSLYELPINWPLALILIVGISAFLRSIATAFKPGLRSIPGPVLAQFSQFYRPWKIAKGNAPDFYLKLHENYGRIVRTGPKTVDISDPAALPIIYGISSKFLKVGDLLPWTSC